MENLIKSNVPFEGEIREYKDGKYRFTSGHWQKLDKKLKEKLSYIERLYDSIVEKYKELDFFRYIKLRKFDDETVDLLLAKYFKLKNKRFTYTKDLNRKFLINFASNLEECFLNLPAEHLINNSYIQSFDIRLDKKDGYAYYKSTPRTITFSKAYIKGVSTKYINNKELEPDKILDVEDPHELKATLIHEIGHGIWEKYCKSNKIKKDIYYWNEEMVDEDTGETILIPRTTVTKTNSNIEKLKDFSELCGFGRYDPFKYEVTPIGRIRKIKRDNNINFDLITDYALLNPQEAFSEYYSFYSLYPNIVKEIINDKKVDLNNSVKYRFTNISYKTIYENKEIFNFIKKEIFGEDDGELKKAYEELAKVFIKPTTEYADMILVNSSNQILLLKRTKEEEIFPGMWGLPGGHIDNGETPKEASIRECEEETSIKVNRCRLFNIKSIENGTIYYYLSKEEEFNNESLFLIEKEHSNYYWCSIDKLAKLELIPGLKKILSSIKF